MKYIIFLFLTITILYINAGDNLFPNQQTLLQQQRNEQTHSNKKLNKQYNQQSNFNKSNTRAQLKYKNQKTTKFTGRKSHPR